MTRHHLSTAQRGYGAEHRQLREQWKPYVDAGQVACFAPRCVKPTRWIIPGTPWVLGHTPDRTGWTGPEHQACGCADGGRRGAPMRHPRPVPPPSQSWSPTRDW
jgi:hypothetical protein